jgi:hypothetical protein
MNPFVARTLVRSDEGVRLLNTLNPRRAASLFGWFAGREEIDFVDTGISDKVGLGYIILEWMECEIDLLFLAILRDEEIVADYTIYTRDLEGVIHDKNVSSTGTYDEPCGKQ